MVDSGEGWSIRSSAWMKVGWRLTVVDVVSDTQGLNKRKEDEDIMMCSQIFMRVIRIVND